MVRPTYRRCPAAAALALAAMIHGPWALGNDDLVLLDFWSPNCGPCMQMKPTVQSLQAAGYPVREVDVSREPQLARDFRIERIPCFVMLVNGQEVDRVVGATEGERLVQMFNRARVRLQSPDESRSVPWPGVDDASARSVPVGPDHLTGDAPPSTPAADSAYGAADVPASLLAATVRLRVQDEKGQSRGTGTIIDTRSGEALVITCGHIFRDSQGQGQVSVELFESGPGGVRPVGQVPGQVLSYDLDRDVALLSIRPDRPVSVAPVAPRQTNLERGDRAVAIGCSNGADPTALPTRINSFGQGPPRVQASGAPVEGRSGGGLFDAKGQLIGVCFAADYEGNEGLYASLESIHGELDRLGLNDIYASTTSQPPPEPRRELSSVVRGQEPLTPVLPVPNEPAAGAGMAVAVGPDDKPAAAPQNLSAAEQAAWEEIMSRAATHEVICIIRPKEPGGQSEVFTLDNVSSEFVRGLAARQRPAEDRLTR